MPSPTAQAEFFQRVCYENQNRGHPYSESSALPTDLVLLLSKNNTAASSQPHLPYGQQIIHHHHILYNPLRKLVRGCRMLVEYQEVVEPADEVEAVLHVRLVRLPGLLQVQDRAL